LVHEDRPGPDQPSLVFLPARATLHFNKDEVGLVQDDQDWQRAFPLEAKQELEEIQQVLWQARNDQSDTMEIPKDLQTLRKGDDP